MEARIQLLDLRGAGPECSSSGVRGGAPTACWRSRAQLELTVVEYIGWSNHDRLHDALGDTPPARMRRALLSSEGDQDLSRREERRPRTRSPSNPVRLGSDRARPRILATRVYDDRSMTSVTPSTINEMPVTRDAIATTGNATAQTPRRPPPSSE